MLNRTVLPKFVQGVGRTEILESRYTLINAMASSENLLTHDEIWDDSALVNAWDEALQEYKVRSRLRGFTSP